MKYHKKDICRINYEIGPEKEERYRPFQTPMNAQRPQDSYSVKLPTAHKKYGLIIHNFENHAFYPAHAPKTSAMNMCIHDHDNMQKIEDIIQHCADWINQKKTELEQCHAEFEEKIQASQNNFGNAMAIDLESTHHDINKHDEEIRKKLIQLEHICKLITYKSQKTICEELHSHLKGILDQSITRNRRVMTENQDKFASLIKSTQNTILKAIEDYLIFEVIVLKKQALKIIHSSIIDIEKFVQSEERQYFKSTLSRAAGPHNVNDILNRIVYICSIIYPISKIYELKEFNRHTKSLFFTKEFEPIKKIFLNFKIYAKETFSKPMLEIFTELSKKHQQKVKSRDKLSPNQRNKYNLQKNIAHKNFFKRCVSTDICLLNCLVAQQHTILEKLIFWGCPTVALEKSVLNAFLKIKETNIEKRLHQLIEKTDLKIRAAL